MGDQDARVLTDLGRYLDPELEIEAEPPRVEQVGLDDSMLAEARAAIRAPWYASWMTGALIPGAPLLGLLMGLFGGIPALVDWSVFGLVMLFIIGPVLGIIWLALFMGHRDRVAGIRNAIWNQAASRVTGPLSPVDGKSIRVGDLVFECVHHITVPAWARTQPCTVVFGESVPRNRRRPAISAVISVTGPNGETIYPPAGALPMLLTVPSLIASIGISIALTSAFNAQAHAYNDASDRLQAITNATQCTGTSKPGDDCYTWENGTIAWEGGYTLTGTPDAPQFSSCRTMLRWGESSQEGDVRVSGANCTTQLAKTAAPARIQVLHGYAIQAQVGPSTYQTDRWPPLGSTAEFLARIFSVGTFIWVAWPFLHTGISIFERVRRATAARPTGIPSPPASAPA